MEHHKPSLVQYLRRIVGARTPSDDDGRLLRRFAETHDEGAFADLVQRHGALVLRVCRQVLQHADDADDAFQATFLILARKAGSIRTTESLPGWLYRVAYHVAGHAKTQAIRRRQREQRAASDTETRAEPDMAHSDLWPLLHAEVNQLPAKYRTPIVLCYLNGKTNEQAAEELGWPLGTLKIRLTRGRDRLRDRLTRRGVALSAGIAAVLAEAGGAPAAPSAAMLDATVRAAVLSAAGEATLAAGLSEPVLSLVEGGLRTMFLNKLKPVALGALLLALVAGAGTHLLWPTSQAADPGKVFQDVRPDAPEVKADKTALVQGNNQFAFDLYGRLRQEKGNLFLSPYSISTALGMTSAGARKDSLTQMEKTLRFPVEQTRLHPAFGALLRDTKAGKGYQLSVANALWCQVNYPFHDDFLKVNETYYGGKPVGVDFRKTEEARQTINTWVEKQTQDKIKELLKPGVLDADTRLVLTNAIYFKGNWADKFDKKLTQDQPFLTGGNKVTVPLMRRTGDYKYLDGGSFQALELPYANKELSMLVFLPKKVDGLAEFEQTLTAEKLQAWQGQMRQREVRVFLPRFKMTAEFKLNNVLQALGMSDVFDRGRSNLSGITNAEQLYISAVIHKAFVDVNEEGTEAAAATAVLIAPTSAPVVQAPPEFRADHPFFFAIRDNRSGSLLFAGRLVEPEKSN